MTDRQTIEALSEALDDEYKARAAYRKVIEVFGPVQPFVNIVEAEGRHIEALLAQFGRFGVEPPQDTWPSRVTVPRTVAEACEAAVQAEIDNEAMYERLIPQMSDPIVRGVLRRLQQASQERHLPAFRRCLSRELGSTGAGLPGRGPRHGTRTRQ